MFYAQAEFKYDITRNYLFYLVFIVFPTSLLSIISLLSMFHEKIDKFNKLGKVLTFLFLIISLFPSQIGIGIGVLTAMTLILTIVADSVPRKKSISVLGQFTTSKFTNSSVFSNVHNREYLRNRRCNRRCCY